ncbi:hypothetical protein Barb7_01983 [Bacteroidales bacterium Barb7]|nr:hypothetical protein Barb7_01983 [Bacteroidales bacterium Barb7]
MLRRCPKWAKDFSPTFRCAPCGVYGQIQSNKALKGRYKLQMVVYNTIYIRLYIRAFFQNFIDMHLS